MKVFNTLTNKKEEFKPLQAGKVSMYVCGPTVYNYIHLGNARSVIAFDTIRRYLEYRGYQVKFVSNFTDVDDKMINEARCLGITVPELAEKFIAAFKEDTKALNVEPATLNPRATHEIPAIIAFVQKLIDKGHAYQAGSDVYYRTRKFKHYGELSKQNLDQLEEGASERLNPDEQTKKEDPLDFALWKGQKEPDEIAWHSPWGKGRPGWHIECSVMSTKYLGDTLDIHGGGADLTFPHHENEIAQSEAATGQKFVDYWLHNGFVTVGKEETKMSKSLHNFITVREALKQYDPQALRFFMASVQYRRPINFSKDNIDQAGIIVQRFQNILSSAEFRIDDQTDSKEDPGLAAALTKAEADFKTAMDDDFNVQNALTAIYSLLTQVNDALAREQVDKAVLRQFVQDLTAWLQIFGLDFSKKDEGDAAIEELVKKRAVARKNKDWATSDAIRDQLKEMGITVLDTPQGTRWQRD